MSSIAGTEFQSPDVAHRVDRQGEHENAGHISPVRGKNVRLRQRHDEVRSAELPSFGPLGPCGEIPGITFGSSVCEPPLHDADLGVAERPMSDELAVAGLGLPRRHQTAFRHRRNQGRPLSGGWKRQQAERGGSVRVMADPAVVEDDRRDVPGERDRPVPSGFEGTPWRRLDLARHHS